MTKKQYEKEKATATRFNAMLAILRTIAKADSLEWLQKNSEKRYGLEYHEALEMAYENLIEFAKSRSAGVSPIPVPELPKVR